MEVIKQGVKPEDEEHKEHCHKCGCDFTYTEKDIQSDFRDGPYVVCPTCKGFISAPYTHSLK